MDSAGAIYHEHLLHWIWENKHFAYQQVQTVSGQKIVVHSPGRPNKSDGPDFKAAEIVIGDLRWYGDVEIHWRLTDWKAHGHQQDPNFNNVVLHVVFEETQQQVYRTDHSCIPTLCLTTYLSKSLLSFLDQYMTQPQLPCAGHLPGLSQDVFAKQLKKAHTEYFEQKVDDLLVFYDPTLPPSLAWKKMLCVALFDGLGISHNRKPMRQLALILWETIESCTTVDDFQELALQTSQVNERDLHHCGWEWKHKGCRPGNHPLPRINQGAHCLWYIYHLSIKDWIHRKPSVLWNDMISSIAVKPTIGRERSSILFGTVFLPSLFALGNLVYSERIKSRSWKLWQKHRVPLPSSLLKLLNNTPLPADLYNHKLGTIYQLRTYCQPKQCQNCEVFKNIIYS